MYILKYFFFLLIFPISLFSLVINIYNTSSSNAINKTVSDSKNLASNDALAEAINKYPEVKKNEKEKSNSLISSFLFNYKNYFFYSLMLYYIYQLDIIPFSCVYSLFKKSTVYIKKKLFSTVSFLKNKLVPTSDQSIQNKQNVDKVDKKIDKDSDND